jgi:hypothetical protein
MGPGYKEFPSSPFLIKGLVYEAEESSKASCSCYVTCTAALYIKDPSLILFFGYTILTDFILSFWKILPVLKYYNIKF